MKCSFLILALALGLFIASGCNLKFTGDNSSAANSGNSKPKTNRPAPDFTVSATDLLNEGTADRYKSEKKYAGKQIAVTGRYQRAIMDKTPMLASLEAGSEFVICKFDEAEKENVAALKEGQNVTMQCLGGNHWALAMPALEHCAVIKVE